MGDERDERSRKLLEKAATRPRASLNGGKCSNCGCAQEGDIGNFCPGCGATFLTDGQIVAGELNDEPWN